MADSLSTAPLNLGFLTVLRENSGYLGGYLVTNQWGRPLEFRLSTAVQPNRVQQILYGDTLEPYICADLIGKTLVDKTTAPVQIVFTDTAAVLDLRQRLEVPVAYLHTPALPDAPLAARRVDPGGPDPNPRLSPAARPTSEVVALHGETPPTQPEAVGVRGHPLFPADGPVIEQVVERLRAILELTEPFSRIREAISEARKMGVTNRG